MKENYIPNYQISLTPYNCGNCAYRWYDNKLKCVRHNYQEVGLEYICTKYEYVK